MRVYLIQHGDAVDEAIDPERPLSPTGVREVGAVAAFAGQAGVYVPTIWHSGKLRASQTADILAKTISPDAEPEQREGLNPKDGPGSVAKELNRRDEDVAVVGHLPHLARLASRLLDGDEDAEVIAFERGGIVALERISAGRWQIVWMVVPSLL